MIIADKLWVQDRIEGGLAGRYNYKRLGDRDRLGRVCVGGATLALLLLLVGITYLLSVCKRTGH
jgi:hypothetical protein